MEKETGKVKEAERELGEKIGTPSRCQFELVKKGLHYYELRDSMAETDLDHFLLFVRHRHGAPGTLTLER